jgi:hypothetical protein
VLYKGTELVVLLRLEGGIDRGQVGRVVGVVAEAELEVVVDLVLIGEIGPAEGEEVVLEARRVGRAVVLGPLSDRKWIQSK